MAFSEPDLAEYAPTFPERQESFEKGAVGEWKTSPGAVPTATEARWAGESVVLETSLEQKYQEGW